MKISVRRITLLVIVAAVVLMCAIAGISVADTGRAWTIVATYSIPESASGLAWDGTYLYCGIYGANGGKVYRIDPSDGSYTEICTGPQEDAFGLTYDGTYLWTTDHPGSSSIPADAIQFNFSGGSVSSFALPDHYMSGIAYDNGDFWVATYYPDPATIYKVDNAGSIIHTYTAPDNQPWDLCLENGGLWMADYWGDALYRIDTSDGSLLETHASEGVDPAGIVFDGTYLWYCDNGSGGVDFLYKVDLSGSGNPVMNIPVTEYNYGTITTGNSATYNAVVENDGTASLIIDSVTFAGSTDLTCTATFPVTIPASSQDQLPLVFAPTAYGPLTAIATVFSNDPVHPTGEITLTGDGVTPGPDISVTEGSHDWGTTRIGSYSRWLLTVENHGDAVLTISDVSSDDGHFIIDKDMVLPMDIGVLEFGQIGIWFQPELGIPYASSIRISSNDPDNDPVEVPVNGIGLDKSWPIGDTLWQFLIDVSYDNSPKAIAGIEDMTEDGFPEVIICSEDNYVRCFNGNSHGTADILWEHEIVGGAVYSQAGLEINEDVDGDGLQDVVVGSAWGGKLIRCMSGKTGHTIWTHDTHEYGDGGWVYAVDCSYDYNSDGTVDVLAVAGDDAGDIGPKRAYCLNGLTGVSLWECPLGGPGFGVVGVSDFTGDGIPDAVAGASNEDETQGKAIGINGATGGIEWTFNAIGSSVWAVEQVDDFTSDGIPDIIVGDFSFGSGNIYGLDATDGSQEYTDAGFGSIIRFEKLNDVSGDGHPDIIPVHSSNSARVINGQTGATVWSQSVVDKVFSAARCADVSGDGIDDIMIGTVYSSNYVYFLDGVSGATLYSVDVGSPVDAIGTMPDVVGDGSWEMVAGCRNGRVYCFSGGLDAAVNQAPAVTTIWAAPGGVPGLSYENTFVATDPEADDVYLFIEWGDGQTESWIGPFASGSEVVVPHTWDSVATFSVRAKARDIGNNTGEWSETDLTYIVLCGDINADGAGPNIADLTYLVAYLFGGGPPLPWEDAGDINASGGINIADLTYLVAYLFGGGPDPDCVGA